MRKPLLSLVAVALVVGGVRQLRDIVVRAQREQAARSRASPADCRTGAAGRDALRRGDLRGPGRQSLRRSRRGPRLDLRARRRHRVLHDRPALHRRRQPARSRQRARRGVGQRVRPGLPRPGGRRLRDHRRRRADALRRARRGPGPDRPPGPRRARPGPRGRLADVRHRHLGLDGARGPARTRQGCAADPRRRARPRRSRRGRRRSARTPAWSSNRHRRARRTGSSTRSTSSDRAAPRTSRPACGSATSRPARR